MNLKIEKIQDVITSIPTPIIREAWSIDNSDKILNSIQERVKRSIKSSNLLFAWQLIPERMDGSNL